jgi:4-hydroxy-tetrahydrodipicolinate reductase
MMEVSKLIACHMPHCEIVELHHDQKLDAPSGTSLMTAELISAAREESPEPPGPENNAARGIIHKGIPIHSVRLPGLVAHQEVIFGGKGQTLSLRHDSISRDSFMPGVVLAVRRVADLEDYLVVGLEKLL